MTRDRGPRPEPALGGRTRWARAALTFDAEIRATAASIERLCRKSPEKMRLFFDGHVSGIKNLVYGKAADMALLYAAIRSADRDSRLRALARLRDEAQNYLGLEMPYNTRRALIALVKETVKAQGDPLQSYRYVSAFRQTLSGRATTVRWMLDELGLAEVPETGVEATGAVAPRASGWDDHVYDNAGPGRKTPAQLVLDAYIKGLSRLTIVYEDLMELEPLEEALEAGKIMGIRVTIGLECLVQTETRKRFYHVLLLDACSDAGEARDILSSPPFKRLLKLVQQNYDEYEGIYERLVEEFNERSLGVINDGFEGTAGALLPLSVKALKAWAKDRHLFHVHLGQYLARALGEVAE
ncbi:MAG: hypothetical protein Q8M76_18030, partial [Spirochaetaceae bacterium]|nr:hypothetical protein [Spirochaetaceae bacterium]